MQLAIVERGQFSTYELLCRTFANDPGVRVIWDRRVGERRQTVAPANVDQRRADRRRAITASWRPHRFIMVNVAEPSTAGNN